MAVENLFHLESRVNLSPFTAIMTNMRVSNTQATLTRRHDAAVLDIPLDIPGARP